MKKNKIAGLVVASALFVGAGASHSHVDNKVLNNKNTNNKNTNKILLTAPSKTMTKNAMVVNGNGNLVLRSSADSNSQVISNISVGEMLSIQSYTANWYKVTVKETGATGYISASNLRYIESSINAPLKDLNNNGHVINVSSSLNLRSEASMSSEIITTLKNGTSFKILGKQGEWFKINVNGNVGFVYGGYVAVGSQIIAPVKKETVRSNPKVIKTSDSSTQNSKKESIKKSPDTKVESNKTEVTKTQNNEDVKKAQLQKAPISLIAIPQNTVKPSNDNLNKVTAESNKNTQTNSEVTKPETSKPVVETTQKKDNNTIIKDNNSNSTESKENIANNSTTSSTNKHEDNKIVSNNSNKNQVIKPEIQKPQVVKPEVDNNKVDNNKHEVIKPEISKPQNDKHETVKPEVSKPEVSKPETVKPDVQKPVVTTGSLTLTIYQTNTDQPLKNTTININDNSYTTDAQGKIKLTDLSEGSHNFSISSKGFNPTSVISNVKAGKNMNKLIYITKSVENIPTHKPVETKPSTNNTENNNHHNEIENNSNAHHESKAQLQQDIVNYAENFLGRPYVWGATGPNAFDCSGLTYYVYKHFGYYIGRTTYTQIDKGIPVALNNLEPGDLIFWGDPTAPHHVAIYIGNGQYIQAPKPGESVDISSWNLNNISAARRIV